MMGLQHKSLEHTLAILLYFDFKVFSDFILIVICACKLL